MKELEIIRQLKGNYITCFANITRRLLSIYPEDYDFPCKMSKKNMKYIIKKIRQFNIYCEDTFQEFKMK